MKKVHAQQPQPHHQQQQLQSSAPSKPHYRTISGTESEQDQQASRRLQRHLSVSPRRFIEREDRNRMIENIDQSGSYTARSTNSAYQFSDPLKKQTKPSGSNNVSTSNSNYFNLEPAEKQLKYIERMEYEFDMLMKHKQQLDSQLTRLPYKANNATMQHLRQSVENELEIVEKKLSSVKLELRKLNIIKSH
jgi:hypothetical protein